jgi:hypothetical protein
MMHVRSGLVLVCLLWAVPAWAQTETHYVRAGASCTSDCHDWTNAYNSLQDAENNADVSRGDTIYVADGSYGSVTFDKAVSGTTTITVKKATASDHGTETGWLSTYGDGQATFTKLTVASNYWIVDGQGSNPTGGDFSTATYGFRIDVPVSTTTVDYCLVVSSGASNLQFDSIHCDCASSNARRGVRLYNTGTTVSLSNIQVSGFGDDPFLLHTYSGLTLEYIWIHTRQSSTGAHADAIVISNAPTTSGTKNILRYSKIDWPGQQMWFDGIGGGGTFGAWDIYGNVFTNPADPPSASTTAVKINDTVVSGGPIKMYNNTFVSLQSAFVTNSGVTGEAYNNIFYDLNNGVTGFDNYTHNYNYFDTALGSSFGEANAQTGGSPFTNFASRDYTLAAATSAGTTLASPYNADMTGKTRGSDGTWDRGAFEYDAGSSPLNITTSSPLTSGTVGAAYSVTLAAGGGTAPYTWTNNGAGTTLNDADSHCAGLTISSAGVVSGTPTTAGTCDWTAKVTDNVAATDTQAFSITISTITITTDATLTGANEDSPYSVTLSATGGTTPYTWTESGSNLNTGACAGLTLADSGDNGVVSGTPTSSGTCTFTAQVSDNNTVTQTKGFTITVTTSGSSALINLSLVMRYYFDEAASGSTPTTVTDWGVASANLTLDYGSGNLSYVTVGANRGLESTSVTGTQKASRVIDDTSDTIREGIEGAQKLTIEFVLRVDVRNTSGQSRVFGIIDEASDVGRLMVKAAQGSDDYLLAFNGTNVESWALTTTEAAIWHVVIDTTAAAADDRVVVYKNGTAVTTTSTAAITQNATLDLSVSQQLIAMNRIASERSFDGRLAYAAIYGTAFTESQVDHNVDVLTISDDNPQRSDRIRLRIR